MEMLDGEETTEVDVLEMWIELSTLWHMFHSNENAWKCQTSIAKYSKPGIPMHADSICNISIPARRLV